MKSWLISIGLSLVLSHTLHAETTLRFAPLPMEKGPIIITQVKPMLDYLQAQTGFSFEIVYQEAYQKILAQFEAEQIDLAFLGPLPYVILSEQYPAVRPLARFLNAKGEDTYTCSLVHLVDQESNDFKGKKVALTQPYSTCGYLYTAHLLKQQGVNIEQTQYRYVGNHADVALGIIRGEFFTGGLKTSIGKHYNHLGLSIVASSKPLPGFVLVANLKTVSEDTRQAIANALLRLHPLDNEQDKQVTANWGEQFRYGSVASSDADFAEIRQEYRTITLPMQGNW